MARLLAAVLSLSLVALAGCRDNPLAPTPPAVGAPAPGAGLGSLYIKGGTSELPLGRAVLLRSQAGDEAVRYSWNFYDGGLIEVDYTTSPREVVLTGRIQGDLTVEVFAYNGTGRLVARGERHFTVVR